MDELIKNDCGFNNDGLTVVSDLIVRKECN